MRASGRLRQAGEHPPLSIRVVERRCGPCRRLVGRLELASAVVERERQLAMAVEAIGREPCQPSSDGCVERVGARHRALVQDRQRQPHVLICPFCGSERRARPS